MVVLLMKTSESLIKISPDLLLAQKSIKFAVENAKNPHLKNNYADLSSVIDAVKTHLNNNNIVFMQSPTPSDDGRLHLTTRLLHTSGEWIEDTATCPLSKQDPQGFGSALTYLRRYSLSAICGLYADDDDGDRASNRDEGNRLSTETMVKQITNCKSMDELMTAYQTTIALCKGDVAATKAVVTAKDQMKSLFETMKG